MYWEKSWGREHGKGNNIAPEKLATTRTEDGYK
jgi:hypothetical protein